MKKFTVSFMLMLIMGFMNPGISQSLYLSTNQGKTCKVTVLMGQIKDNFFDVTIRPMWIGSDLKPLVDKSSVICFDRNNIINNQAKYVKLISPVDQTVFADNALITLKYEVLERFQGGDIILKFPFMYASSKEAAADPKSREEFSFKRPRDFSLAFSITKKDIIDKLPPQLTILLPKKVEEGFKPIVDTSVIKVQLLATDASGIEKVTINNNQAIQVNDSIFTFDLPLEVGYENNITAAVTDVRGKVTTKQFKVEARQPQVKTIQVAAAAPVTQVLPKVELSDVDIDIPEGASPDPLRFALIIGNEDYSSYQAGLQTEMNVEFALRDAETFKEYAMKIMGVPNDNLIFLKNAKALEMHRALNQINAIIKNSKGTADVIVFYAGHGFPDEKTKEPFLVPVDVSGSDLQFAIKLTDFYKKLTEFPSKRVTVFLDACFSGGGRDLGLMAARGVKVKPKENILNGNLVVFTASSGEQSSLPYREKQHGLFTYFLLKKIKESAGDLTYQELSNYLTSNIGIRSVMVNNKEQNPQTNISPVLGDKWKEWKLK